MLNLWFSYPLLQIYSHCTLQLHISPHLQTAYSLCTYQRSSYETLSGGIHQTHFLVCLIGSKGLSRIKGGVIARFSSYQSVIQSVIQSVSQSASHASGLSWFRYRPSCSNTPFLPIRSWALINGHEHHHLLKHMRSLSHHRLAVAQCRNRLDNIKIFFL